MDAELLARIQFAFTVAFHFIFPPLTIGMAWVIVWMMGKYKNTKSELWRDISRFWVKLFTVSFAVGVATGITMEFQFGTNWANYSRFVGDIFGAPLAAEGVFAFFLESTFLGVLIFGWNKLSPKGMWLSALMVAIGSTMSALWIIIANSWMQTPAGFVVTDGRAVLTDFWAAALNPSTVQRYLHTVLGALVTGSFFVAGISARLLIKNKHVEIAKESVKIAVVFAFAASVLQLGAGHAHAVQVAKTQPAKLAAFEGLFETKSNAPLLVFGVPNYETRKVDYGVEIPGGLSLLAGNSTNTVVKGLNDFPRDEWPPMALTFFPFHLMFALGMLFIAFSAWTFYLQFKGRLIENKTALKLLFWAIPLPFITNELGWIAAEVGRQPWIVQGVLKTKDAISVTVPAWQILFTLILFALVYALLFYLWIFLVKRIMDKGLADEAKPAAKEGGAQ